MNILLLGKDGQVGRELSRGLLLQGRLTALGRADLDITNHRMLQQTVQSLKPNLIVNAAAYTAVDKAEENTAFAYQINEKAVEVLAEYSKKHGATLVHYSTDYVFDGTKNTPYVETDKPNPLNAYGASKLAGEEAVISSHCMGYIFRTSWVFSLLGSNFIKTILNLSKSKESLSVVNDQCGVPTSAEFLSDVTLLAIQAAKQDQLAPGIYHLTPKGSTTWYDLARYIVDKSLSLGALLNLDSSGIKPIPTEEYPLPAKRPKNSLLDHGLLFSTIGVKSPDWSVYVDRIIDQLIQTKFFA